MLTAVRAWPVLLLFLAAACAGVGPRFDPTIAASFARDEMRVLTTPDAEIYYPAQARPVAEAMASRLGRCLRLLRTHAPRDNGTQKALIFLTSANFNNAYVTGQGSGEPLHSLLPLTTSSELFHWFGFSGNAVGDIGCHELFHYVHYEQVTGVWRGVNQAFGPVFAPQDFLERWFTEGLAQYYEGRLDKKVGRPHAPLYRASFESGVASRGGKVTPGDLSALQRELLPSSGAYLGSLPFVEFLATRYGEERLWELIAMQGDSVVSPLGVSLRFKLVYGETLGTLVDRWSEALEAAYVPRPAPASQTVLRAQVGFSARLAAAPDGTLAVISQGLDEPPRLRLLEADGRVRAEQRLVRLTPDREWVSAGPQQMSGLSFTADSRWLFLMNDDLSSTGEDRAQLWKLDASTGEVVQVWQGLGGRGGTVSPDGRRYLFVSVAPGRDTVTALDLETGERKALRHFGAAVGGLSLSPDGKRLALSAWTHDGFDLFVLEPDGELRQLTSDARSNYGAHWVDGARLLLPRELDGRLQAHLIDAAGGDAVPVSAAPFAAFDAATAGGALYFLDREGWSWDVVRAPLDPVGPALAVRGEQQVIADGPAQVESDVAYAWWDHLGVPQLRLPSVDLALSCPRGADCTLYQRYGALLTGKDRLSFHSWALGASVYFPQKDFSVSGGYVNTRLAPWFVELDASYDQYGQTATAPPTREVSFAATASRSVYSTPISFTFSGFVRSKPQGVVRYLGPQVSVDYFAGESTPYGGLRRGFGMGASAALYPRGLGSQRDVFDLTVSAVLAFPLPFSRRHSFVISFLGRTVEGAPDGALQVGGQGRGGYELFVRGDRTSPETGPTTPLPRFYLVGLRGYEDWDVHVSRAVTSLAVYRYPFVIDRGFASLLYVLPSFFVRQIDAELFGSAALLDRPAQPWMRSAGAGVAIRTALGSSLGLSLSYRLAFRFDYGLPPLHALTLSFD